MVTRVAAKIHSSGGTVGNHDTESCASQILASCKIDTKKNKNKKHCLTFAISHEMDPENIFKEVSM